MFVPSKEYRYRIFPKKERNFWIQFLVPVISHKGSGDIVDRFLKYIGDFKKEISTRQIAADLFTNTRTLELKFCAITGTTPGQYIRLKRFNRLKCDVASKKYRMRDLVAKHNYSDYSHMRRDIRKYSGVSHKEIATADNLEKTPIGAMM